MTMKIPVWWQQELDWVDFHGVTNLNPAVCILRVVVMRMYMTHNDRHMCRHMCSPFWK